ncbi:hypothetical protein DB32_006689 [Sandaracinus amylolyticus]|uniref:Uncharacterized protein n=1 Tax=Sandaracinus amylolyticus TaxID=927083 RepID=A0A0F6W7W0_9BACT|nr:hypothetical protein DB32_006689 [Sandaracinus amylolyticus]
MLRVRAITFVLVGCAASIVCAGCYLSHDVVSARDGSVTDAPITRDASRDASRVVGCDAPVREWPETFAVYPGEYARAATRIRFGETTWVAAHAPSHGTEVLQLVDGERGAPVLERVIAVDGELLRPIAGARDDARIALALAGRSDLQIHVLDADGEPLARGLHEPLGTRVTMALRERRIGVVLERGPDTSATAWVLDASSALDLVRVELDGSEHAGVGLGRSSFAIVATPRVGESRLWGLDDAGVIDAGAIGARMIDVTWDESTAFALDERALLVRRPGRAVERIERGLSGGPEVSIDPSGAVHGAAIWHATGTQMGTVEFLDDEGPLASRSIEGLEIRAVMAHASRRHRGAFVLVESLRALVWVGWSCDPDA